MFFFTYRPPTNFLILSPHSLIHSLNMMKLYASSPSFPVQFSALLSQKREVSEDVDATARAIVRDVREKGDDALVAYTNKFDRVSLTPADIRVLDAEIAHAIAACKPADLEALAFAAARIRAYHERQKPKDDRFTDSLGVELGYRYTAIENVGLYVPGGTASYPSSVLMNAIPAKVAGCDRLVMVVPAPDGVINPLVLAAASLAGVHEIYKVGGAQAIAALAYGTKTIAPVDKIFGPGNAYVASAKRLVFGQVGIDMVAGPSEVLIIADDSANASYIAADLLAQAEHDTAAQSLLITTSKKLAHEVELEVEAQLKSLPREKIARKSWEDYGAIIIVETLEDAIPLANKIAAEHLEIMTRDDEVIAAKIRHAGAIFLGEYTPEAIGDYVGGSNHVLPTSRSARFSSGLGVPDYMKRTSILKCGKAQLQALGKHAIQLGEAESLTAHARSVSIRL
jgi:histidinol dehydrogenase